jgi:hypothetical protein
MPQTLAAHYKTEQLAYGQVRTAILVDGEGKIFDLS